MQHGPACPVCGSKANEVWASARDVEYHTSDDVYEYRRCTCGVTFIDPMPTSRLAEIYPPNYYAYASGTPGLVERIKQRLDARLFRRLLGSLDGEHLRVLDVGGGDGWLLSVIREIDPRVQSTMVVDLDPDAEALARGRGHDYFCGPVETFDTDGQFDLVLLLNIIEHVADPVAVMGRVRKLLAPGGVALVKTPNTDSLDARLFRRRNWGGYHCPRHWVLFDRAGLESLAAGAGLRIRRFSYTQGAPFWTVGTLASLSRRGAVRVNAQRPMVRHPLFSPLNAAFAAFDIARGALGGRTSQMFFELESVG
jgi:SAM-dependent methyltransferase